MAYYAALDVSLNDSALCVLDADGNIVRERKVISEPEAVVAALWEERAELALIGLEAGPLSQWLFDGLAEAGYPVVCCETRHTKAFLKARRTKTDRNDARGIAQMIRTGLYQDVHVKTRASQRVRTLLSARKTLQAKAIDIESSIRGLLRNFGLKVGQVSVSAFAARVRWLIADDAELQEIIEPLLESRARLRRQFDILDRKARRVARADTVCQQFMTVPGVGPLTALTYKAGVDQPQRFDKARTVGVHFGLTPSRYESGEIAYDGRISRCGDVGVRTQLYEAAQAMLTRTRGWSWLKAWAMDLAKRRGRKKAIVALARRLAVILHRMWRDGTTFQYQRAAA
jgi:transposase